MNAAHGPDAVAFQLNGSPVTVRVTGAQMLLGVLRRQLGQTGAKEGCHQGECGACTVLVDGRAVCSCLYPAQEAEGRDVVTIEGLSPSTPESGLSILQRSFVEHGAIQCGFCTPGMIMAARELLDRNATPSDEQIREALSGNICRCTGYVQIVEAVRQAAAELREERRAREGR